MWTAGFSFLPRRPSPTRRKQLWSQPLSLLPRNNTHWALLHDPQTRPRVTGKWCVGRFGVDLSAANDDPVQKVSCGSTELSMFVE